MAPLNPTLMAATASQRDLSQKIASRIGFSSIPLWIENQIFGVVCTLNEFLSESIIVK